MRHTFQLFFYITVFWIGIFTLASFKTTYLWMKIAGISFFLPFYFYYVNSIWFLTNNKVSKTDLIGEIGTLIHGAGFGLLTLSMFLHSHITTTLILVVVSIFWLFGAKRLFESIMEDVANKDIWVWYPGSNTTGPLRLQGWWVQYPAPSCSPMRLNSPPGEQPKFQIGDPVRFRKKPEKLRRVVAVEWHRHRYEFVYIVTTSAPENFQPYWFADQLMLSR